MDEEDTTKNGSSKKQAPVAEMRYGAVKAVVWANDTRNGVMHNVTLVRLYMSDGQWRESASIGRDDLLVAAKALNDAHTWIHQHERAGRTVPPDDAA